MGYVFSGVRPSSGAETSEGAAMQLISRAFEYAKVAVAEDGHTPLNRYPMGEGEAFTALEKVADL